MRKKRDSRLTFLNALMDYGERAGTFNPHFHKKEMMAKLNISEGEFNIIQKRLGDEYCHLVDIHDGDARYAISMDRCYKVRDEARRHKQMMVAMIITIIVGLLAIIGPLVLRKLHY